MLASVMSVLAPFTFSQGRISTQPLRVVALALYSAVLVTEIIFRSVEWCHVESGMRSLAGLVLVLLMFAGLDWAEQRYFAGKPLLMVAIGVLALRILLTEVIGTVDCSGFTKFFALVPPLLAYLYIGRRAAFIVAAINISLYCHWIWPDLMQLSTVQDENLFIEFFIFLVGIVFMIVMGRVLVLEERNRERAEELVVRLERSQQQIAELAAVDERNRIARDIHDSVGHHLTAINIQLEKAIAFRPIDPTEADQALHDAKRSAQAALSDVRDSVSALRDPERQFELSAALRQLVEGFGRIPTRLHIEGSETDYAKSSLMALYRAAQEGLTNIEKHSGADSAELQIKLQPDEATLLLRDDGIGIDSAELKRKMSEGHFGLIGLRERLELLGGTLSISQQAPRGTLLRVRVPARGLG